MRVFLTFALLASSLAGCGRCSEPPLVEAPGARAVAVARAADAIAVVSAWERAGLMGADLVRVAGPALAADAPLVASFLPEGVVVLATRVSLDGAGAFAGAGGRRLLGQTSVTQLGGSDVLLRVDGSRILAALGVSPAQHMTIASLLELMGSSRELPPVPAPPPGRIQLRLGAAALPVDLGVVEAELRLDGASLLLDARAPSPPPEVRAALEAEAPPWACALDRGAALALHLPPLPGLGDDLFRGRAFVGVYPSGAGIGVVIAGVPVDDARWDALLAEELGDRRASGVEWKMEGGLRGLEFAGKRRLRIVRGPGLVGLAADDGPPGVPLEQLAAAQPTCRPSALIRVDSAAIARSLLPAALSPEALLRLAMTGGADQLEPLQALRGIAGFSADAWAEGGGIRLQARLDLRPVPH